MDDPWGSSPWADEVQLPNSIKTKEDAPRPTIPVRAPKLAVDESTTSPWGEDNGNDGLGDWAALPEQKEQIFRLDGAGDDWVKHSVNTGDLTNGQSLALSMNWDAQDTMGNLESTRLASSPFVRGSEPMRQPSPDPWALEIQEEVLEGGIKEAVQGQGEVPSRKVILLDSEREAAPEPQNLQDSIEALVPEPESENEETATIGDNTRENVTDHGRETNEPVEKLSEGERESASHESDAVSRLSSSLSERSHHDELQQESPRTSFDEEPKSKRPQVPRKVSTKVQELVQHFDTLAKQEDPEPIGNRATNAQSTNVDEDSEEEGDENDEDDDFGDFEEGQSDDESREMDITQSSVPITSQHSRTSSLENVLTKDYGVVEFGFEPSKLDGIYPIDTPDPISETVFIPDSIPFDSFSSTEQRKTWYRISRYGTTRKHNSGNDENYIRVGWKPSTIRDDTLKIVSRWIEEDRISGRVVLGGGSKGSTVFGWNDPKAPAVPLSDLFAKHSKKISNSSIAIESVPELPREWPKGLVRDRSTSKTRSPSKPRRKSSVKAASVPVPSITQGGPIAPVANFGWNSTSEAVQRAENSTASSAKRFSGNLSGPVPLSNSTPPPRKSTSPTKSASATRPALHATVDDQPSVPPAQNNVPLPALSISNVVDSDDDWGEMVSTPATPTIPVLSSSKGLRHKKSQSFGGSSHNHSQGGIPDGWYSKPETGQRSTTTFDEILAPQPLSPAIGSLPVTSNVDLFSAPMDNLQDRAHGSPTPTPSTTDPWATADFSFFETTQAAAPKPVPLPISRIAGPKGLKVNPAPSASSRRSQKSREELEQDRIVQSVVRGLPDLSYMLRK